MIADFRPQIEAALAYAGGSHTFDDIAAGVRQGKMQFWPGVASAIVTEIVEYPRHRELFFFLAGGNLEELEAMTPGILEWGKTQGCAHAAFIGRRGWAKTFLSRTGWSDQKLAVFTKAL